MTTGLLQAVCVVLFITSVTTHARVDATQSIRPASSVAITPEKLDFGTQAAHTSSPPYTATLTNVSNAGVTIRDISASGIDFTETNDCPSSLAPGANCRIDVTFTPAITGPRLGTIIVSASDTASPLFLVLTGTGE